MTKATDIQDRLKEKFQAAIKGVQADDRQMYVDIDSGKVRDIAREAVSLGGRYLVSVGYDDIARTGTLGLIHTFSFDRDNLFLCLRMAVPADNPSIESITPDMPSAGWSEREYMDLLGMKFPGHPKAKRLILADDWPQGIYPLRKEIPWNLMPPAAEDVAYQLDEAPAGCSMVPVGPYHPTLHEPAHFAVFVDGETIKGCDYRGFMTHRGIEKLCQTQVTYNEIPFIAERICGICGSVHATAYSQAVERAAGIQISRRAEYIRTLMLEIERLHSHLLWLGVAGHLIGFDTIFMHAWRVREQIMWLSEKITGNRKTYGMIVVGGVRRDLSAETIKETLETLSKVETEVMQIYRAVQGDSAIHRRTKNVGVIAKEDTALWGLVGPVARARGIDIDTRRDHPYAAYGDVKFEVPVLDSCDVWATLVVRVLEIFESIKIIRQLFANMPEGKLLVEVSEEIPPYRHALSAVEAPRGESIHYLITGEGNRPERWRVRAPTYPNLQGVPLMLMDEQFADLPIIIGSIDPCFSCTDRIVTIDTRSGKMQQITGTELETICRQKSSKG